MQVELILIEKTRQDFVQTGMKYYEEKIRHYIPFITTTISVPDSVRKRSIEEQKKKEAEFMRKHFQPASLRILLDEKGKKADSAAFSLMLGQWLPGPVKKIQFYVGGPYGVYEPLKKEFNLILSLSEMTFSHQLIRLIFLEQLYRAFTILKGEKYHHA